MTAGPGAAVTLVLALALGARWMAWRLGLPAIALLAVAGILAGPVLGLLRPSADLGPLLNPLVGLAVAVILFEGGFSLRFSDLRRTGGAALRLIVLGLPLGWLLGAAAAHYAAGLSWPVALVLGAILVVTGPTVVVPMLRQARLRPRPREFLKWEGIINDPLGALLAVLVFELLIYAGPAVPVWESLLHAALAPVGAGLLGTGVGYGLGHAFGRGLVPEFLKAPMLLGFTILVYTLGNVLQEEAGLLAATAMGVTMGNMRLGAMLELQRFKEAVSVLLVSVLFVVLTADLHVGILGEIDWRSAGFVAAMLFLVRPAAVALATVRAYMTWRERVLTAWVAPRGIVAAAMAGALAPELVAGGYPDARLIIPLVFGVILVTVTVHGFSVRPLARGLRLTAAQDNGVLIVGAHPWSVALARALTRLAVPVTVADPSWPRLRRAGREGIATHAGDLLSEIGHETFDLGGVGYLLAVTDNDAYNALLSTRFAPELGREHVFQLPRSGTEESAYKEFSHVLRGRVAFDEHATAERIMERYYQGWRFQIAELSEDFDFDEYLRRCDESAWPILAVRADGAVVIHSPERPMEPSPGDRVVCFRRVPGPAPAVHEL